MLKLCSYLAGSNSYGLALPTSDIDERGVFLNSNINYILGIDSSKSQKFQEERKNADIFYYELRHFFNSLKKTNTQAIELLFNKKWIELDSKFDKLVLQAKYKFIDSEYLYHSLLGYIHNEKRLMNGERTGELGGKRKATLDRLGYSFKNLVQLLRLVTAGAEFFEKSIFPVDISHLEIHPLLMQIKTRPELFTKKEANELVDKYEPRLHKSFENRQISFMFDEKYVEWVCVQFYLPIIHEYQERI